MNAIYLFLMFAPLIIELIPKIKAAGLLVKIKLLTVSIGSVFAFLGHGDQILVVAIAIGYADKIVYYVFLSKKKPLAPYLINPVNTGDNT